VILGFIVDMMSWKYKGGLLLIVSVVIMWVTSAEVTQVSSLLLSLSLSLVSMLFIGSASYG